jgi:hypothetical protein
MVFLVFLIEVLLSESLRRERVLLLIVARADTAVLLPEALRVESGM